MLDQIMSLVKGEVTKAVSSVPGVPADKKAATVETATSSLLSSLKGKLNAGNLSGMLSAFGGGGAGTAKQTNAIGGSVITALTKKVGLPSGVAQQIVAAAVPAIMALFAKKVADKNEPGFDIGSLLGGLGNVTGKSSGGGLGGLLGSLGGLFGKK